MELKTSFRPRSVIEPLYTGGEVSIAGNVMASTLIDRVVLTNLDTGERLATVEGDGELVTTLKLSPSASHLVVCSRSLLMHVYRITPQDNKLKVSKAKSIKAHESPVMVLDIDPTSTLLATGGAEGAVKVWDLEGGYATHNLRGHGGIISALKFWGQQGSTDWRLASGSDDCKVRVWDLVKSKSLAVLDNHVSIIRGLDFSEDGRVLISGGRDKVVSVWNAKTFKLVTTIPVSETLEATGFVQSSGSELTFYTGGDQAVVKVRNLKGDIIYQQQTQDEPIELADEVTIVAVHSTPAGLFSVLSDQMIIQLSNDDLSVVRRIAGNHGEVIDMCFVDDNRLAVATNSAEIRVISLDSPLECDVLEGHSDIVLSMDSTLEGRWLATSAKDNHARLWELVDGKFQSHTVFSGHAGSIGAVALPRTPQAGRGLPEFVVTGSQDLTVKRWSPKTGSAVYTRKAHDKDINAIDVSPDDRMFATASQDRTVKVWDLETGDTVGILKGHKRGVWTVKFSQWDKTIITGSGDKTVRLWNLNDYSCTRTFEGHSNAVLKVSFLTQSRQIVSSGGDGLVKVWNTHSGECMTTLDNHEDKVWCVAVDERGAQEEGGKTVVVSGSGDSVITVWEDVTEEDRVRQEEETAVLVEQEQELSNYILREDWASAFKLALSLDHPFRLLKLLTQVHDKQEVGSISGLQDVDAIIASLDDESLLRLLGRVRDWNTNARTGAIAQPVLHAILKYHSVDRLSKLKGINTLVESLIPYSERHYGRTEDLMVESSILRYALREMSLTG